MVILINEQEVDFTLEGGEKISDIYNSINTFLNESDHLIYAFTIDGRETDPLNRELWDNLKVKDIKKIEVTALTRKEYLLTGLLTVAEYINLLLRSVTENSEETLNDLIPEYSSIINNIPLLIKGTHGVQIREHMNRIMNNSGLLQGSLIPEYREEFLKEISGIAELIHSASREIEDPRTELSSSIEILKAIIPELNEVSILLQTGKDNQAMGIIIKFTELLQKILRIISFFNTDNININGVNYEYFSIQLNSILNELAEAFDAKDSVLIGDLLEYEISPKLESLSDIVNFIGNREDE